jgi:hypothetical protein
LLEPYGISDAGTVVGFYNADAFIYKQHSFDLVNLGPRQTELIGISTNGLMVGNQFGNSVSYAFQPKAGKVEPLPQLYGMPVQANGIKMLVRSRVTREQAHRFYLREGYELTKTSAVFSKRSLSG